MVSKVTFKVTGAREIEAALKALGTAASNRICRSALNRSANVVVARAKELAPQRGDPDDPYATGLLARSITKRLRRQKPGSSRKTILIGVAGPRARIAHLLELGTAHQPAEPYLRPALDESAQISLTTMRDALLVGVDREVAKLARNTLKAK